MSLDAVKQLAQEKGYTIKISYEYGFGFWYTILDSSGKELAEANDLGYVAKFIKNGGFWK